MAIGRIRRQRHKVRRAAANQRGGMKKLAVEVLVERSSATTSSRSGYYIARACFRGHRSGKIARPGVLSCGEFNTGRTPQSAIAKALADLSKVTATRNPGKRTGWWRNHPGHAMRRKYP